MYLYVNLMIFFCGVVSLFMGYSFFEKEINSTGFFKWAVILLATGNALCNIGYSVMSLSSYVTAAYIFRFIGLVGVNIYLLAEIIMVSTCLNFTKRAEYTIIVMTIIAIVGDLLIWGKTDSNRYVSIDGFTTYVEMDPYGYIYHITHIGALSVLLLILAIIWKKNVKYSRDKQFYFMAILSNAILLAAAIAEVNRKNLGLDFPHFLFCTSMTIAFSVFYTGASRYTAFRITVNTVSRDIFSTINTGLIAFDTDGVMALANRYFRELADMKKNPKLKRLHEIFQIDKKDALEMRERAENGANLDYRLIIRETGKVVLANLSCKYDRSGEPICYLLVATDLTEENRLIEEAQAANVAKSDFLSNMSHEIRTPINVVQGMDELILRECNDPTILKYAENINVASRTLMSLINDVLDFSKIESGKLDVVSSNYNVGSLLYDSYSMALNLAKNKNQKLILECDPNIPSTLVGDDVRIKQVLANLLSNSVKYTPEHGQIKLVARSKFVDASSIKLILQVIDNGIGFRDDDVIHAFDNFSRFEMDKNRTIEGTGLGLAIAKNLVDLMHGTIRLDSAYEMGSTFTIELPQTVVDATPIGDINESYSDEMEAFKVSLRAPKARILSVDDVQMNLDVFAGLLKPTGITIDSAISGPQALDLLAENKYDIVFLDHMMPGMDGVEVLERLRSYENSINANTPVIALTANAVMGVEQKYLEAGFTDYMAKPIKPVALEKMVKEYLPPELIEDETTANLLSELAKETSFLDKLDFLDTNSAMEFAAGDEDFLKQILMTYVAENKGQALEEFFATEDWGNYQIVAHSLKSTSKTIGAIDLSEKAKELEFAAKEARIDYIKENHEDVVGTYFKLVEKLKKAIE
ncbi:MAG: response regulator [Pseudobutyrivibrio sp.]|nr:response regulator [Pseudobutyrivibrio sp.]